MTKVPICSTVLLPSPSMPAKVANAECSFAPQLTDGSLQVVDALLNGPPRATYPAQFTASPARSRCMGAARTTLAVAGGNVTRAADATSTASLFMQFLQGVSKPALGPSKARTRERPDRVA